LKQIKIFSTILILFCLINAGCGGASGGGSSPGGSSPGGSSPGGTITLDWDASTDSDVTGYKVYYGTASRTYGTPIDVGNVMTCTVKGLTIGQAYFLAVTAYVSSNEESDFSDEVSGAAE
jgi:hypothetical protein